MIFSLFSVSLFVPAPETKIDFDNGFFKEKVWSIYLNIKNGFIV